MLQKFPLTGKMIYTVCNSLTGNLLRHHHHHPQHRHIRHMFFFFEYPFKKIEIFENFTLLVTHSTQSDSAHSFELRCCDKTTK